MLQCPAIAGTAPYGVNGKTDTQHPHSLQMGSNPTSIHMNEILKAKVWTKANRTGNNPDLVLLSTYHICCTGSGH